MISDEVGLAIMRECDFDDYVLTNPHNVSKSCNEALADANGIVGEYINNYDVLLDVCYPSIVEQELRLKKLVRTNLSFYCYVVSVSFNWTWDADSNLWTLSRDYNVLTGWTMLKSNIDYNIFAGN